MRVAILEDDRSQADLLTHWLELAGHQSSAFVEGAQFIRALQHDTFDVLLLDWNVPGVSGMEVLRRVRAQMHLDTPAVICTARAGEADVVEALRVGADDYVVEPVRRKELLARVEAVTRPNPQETAPDARQWLAIGCGIRVRLPT
jgi:DNA-binding response OmpR family regulator